jgi:hypothetical protein
MSIAFLLSTQGLLQYSKLSGYVFKAIQKQSALLIAGLKVIIKKRMSIGYSRL